MATGNSGTITVTGTKQMSAVLYWSETYDVASNTHVVSIDNITFKSSNWYGFTYYLNGSITVDGTTVFSCTSTSGTHNVRIDSQNTEYPIAAVGGSLPPWRSGSISGNADGSKSVTIAFNFSGYTTDGRGANGFNTVTSQTVSLYTIPRKSSASMGAATMGSASTISITRASSSFTHTLTYAFGSASGTISTKTSATSVSWTPPLTLANQVPNSTSGTVAITCYTYNGSTLIGSTTCTATLSVPASVKPSFTSLMASRVDGSVPSSWGIYVQGKSKATISIGGATGSYGSTISAYSITGGGYSSTSSSFTTGFLTSTGTITFTGKVMDSRGRWSAERTVSIYVVAYSPPTASGYSVQRCNSSGTVTANGTYGKGQVTFAYSSCSSKNTVTTKTYYKRSSASSYTDASKSFTSGTAFVFGGGNLSVDYTYDIKFEITDAFGTVSVVLTLSTAAVLMDFKAGGTGIGIGKVSETDNLLDCAFNAKFRGMVSGHVASLDGYDSVITSDFNNYKEVGVYIISSDADMQNVSNRPCDSSGTLYVKNSFNDGRSSSGTWVYRLQIFIPYTGSDIYLRSLTVGSTAGSWTYGSWNVIGKNMTVNHATTADSATTAMSATSATSATKATKDGSGNTITSTYLKLSGGSISGSLNIGGYNTFWHSLIGYGSMTQGGTFSGTVPADTRLFIIGLYDDAYGAWYTMAVPANALAFGDALHVKASSDYYTFRINFSGTTATLTKAGAGTKTVCFSAIR